MKHFRLLLNTLFTLGLVCQGYAQTESERAIIRSKTNVAVLEKLAEKHTANYTKRKAEALVFAQQRGLQVLQVLPDGRFAELQYIDDSGTPIYYITNSNRNAAITTRASRLWTGGGLNLSLDGQGMIVGEWDGGAIRASHQEFGGRAIQKDGAPFTSSTSGTNHATHVGGTLIASGVQSSAKGMAHEGTLWANEWNNDLSEMSSQAAEGLIISNHSYGYNADYLSEWQFGFYDSEAAAWDEVAFNAPFYTIVKSAGNDRNDGYNPGGTFGSSGYNLISGASTSKNVLVVAAVSAVTNYTGPSSVPMSSFSSWGPTDDGRIKPDISGCGVNVYSSLSNNDDSYATYSGTSMASPNVAGTLTLIQQHYKNLNNSNFMRSATLRGLAIHTADEAGTAQGPDYRFGWGLLNAENAVNAISGRNISSIIDERTLVTGDGDSYITAVIASGSAPLEVTIAWTDPKGVPLSSGTLNSTSARLVNDLDIRISHDGTTFLPWRLDPASPASAATKGDNFRDNVEKIIIDNPIPNATYTITVSHKNTLQNGTQDYSLIITGIDNTASLPPCALAIPNNLDVSDITSASATLNWDTDDDAVSYDIRIRATGTDTWSSFEGQTTNSINIPGLIAETNYEWQVRTNCTGGTSPYSSMDNFFTAVACSVPIWRNESDITSQAVTLNWAGVSGANTYDLRIRANDSPDWVNINGINATSFNYTELTASKTYIWQVRANCTGGSSSYSSSNSFNSPTEVITSLDTRDIEIEIYPNPVHQNQTLYLHFGKNTEGTIQILNLSGQVMLQSSIKGNSQELDVHHLAEGMYLIQIESKGMKGVRKLIIRH